VCECVLIAAHNACVCARVDELRDNGGVSERGDAVGPGRRDPLAVGQSRRRQTDGRRLWSVRSELFCDVCCDWCECNAVAGHE
jgi:hypothetical protein